jgi:hypothetical protein
MTDGKSVRGPHGVAIGLFVLVWLSCVWFGSWELNPNNATRLFGAIALVEQGDARIDRFQSLTIDKAQFGPHYYMDKAPGITLMTAPVVWLANAVTGVTSRDHVIDATNPKLARFLRLRLRLTVALVVATLTAFAAVLLLDLATGITGNPQAGLFAALGYALGSTVWGWSTTLFGHAPDAALLLIATWAVWRGTSGEELFNRWRYPLMAGAALGWAVVIEFPAALGGLAIALWAIWRTRDLAWPIRRKLFGIAIAAGTVTLVPLLFYNQLAFGTPFKLGYQGVVGFNGMQQGLFGLTYPKPAALFGIIFGLRRGMIWVAPVLVLGVAGLARMVRARPTRDLGILAVAVILIVLMVNASYIYWDGGSSIGPRHSVPAMPFLALGLAPLWAGLTRLRGRIVAVTLLAVSMMLNLIVASAEVFASEAYANPIWDDLIKRRFLHGQLATLPGEWWGWSPWRGFALYLDLALPLLFLLILLVRREDTRLGQSRVTGETWSTTVEREA